MPSMDTPEIHPSQNDRTEREDAIRELARSQAASEAIEVSPHAKAVSPRQGDVPTRRRSGMSRGRRIAIVSGALLVIIGIGIGVKIITSARRVTAPKVISVVTIPFGLQPIQCAQGMAWSPDSRYLALLGYAASLDGCPSAALLAYSYAAGKIAVYDARAGKLTVEYQPDTIIQKQLQLQPPPRNAITPNQPNSDVSAQVISYEGIAWSPNGEQLALPFHVLNIVAANNPHGYDTQRICGLLLLPLNQNSPDVLSQTQPASTPCSGAWDIRDNRYVPEPPTASNVPAAWGISSGLGTAASAYHWNGGSLSPVSALPASDATPPQAASHITPVGAPDGQQSFSIWQPGTLESVTQYFPKTASGTPVISQALPGAQTYSTSFIAWSPSGDYLRTAVVHNWLVRSASVPAPTSISLRELNLTGAPTLFVRDQALDTLLKRFAPVSASAQSSLTLAWRPDGRYLATISPAAANDTGQTATIYDITNGADTLTLTLPASTASATTVGNTTVLLWSPDGSRLAYLAPDSSDLTVWQPSALKSLAAPSR
ncbi:MAG TPA: hypothetical protein VF725_16100 [Ktedonobacterales bacterium]|jgi:hypothetical protein